LWATISNKLAERAAENPAWEPDNSQSCFICSGRMPDGRIDTGLACARQMTTIGITCGRFDMKTEERPQRPIFVVNQAASVLEG